MRTVLLDEAAFHRTFISPMRDVTEHAEAAVDTWAYVSSIPAADLGALEYRDGEVEYVYRSADDRFDHVLIPTAVRNLYLVVVVARDTRTIHGHHVLDLNEKYGLTASAASLMSPEAAAICAAQSVDPCPPLGPTKLGVAVATLERDPLNGMRSPPEGDTCGWYIWGGELSDADDFFQPVHVAHLPELCPRAVSYLCLPPGYRFLLGENDHVDVWRDPSLLKG